MRRSGYAKISLAILTILLLAPAAAGKPVDEAILTEPIVLERPGALEKYISRKVADLISLSHYAKHPIDAEYSSEWFHEYFRQLDPNRIFFLQQDLDEFRGYETILGDLVRRRGNIDFAFDVYERYLQRVQEWAVFTRERVEEPFDLTSDETILLDRREVDWPAEKEEQLDIWRRRVKNRVLMEMLLDEKRSAQRTEQSAENEDATDRDEQGGETEGEAAEAESPTQGTPGERVAESHLRFLNRKLETETMEVVEVFLSSLTRIYDPHSVYMAPETQEDFDISMSLSLQGIGAVLTTKDSYVEVVEVVPGGPAHKDGRLKAGDRIVEVAQGDDAGSAVNVVDMRLRSVVRMIRGPKGTRVHLTVLEAGSSTPTQIDIVRDTVELTASEAKMEIRHATIPTADGDRTGRIAVIDLPSFYCDFQAKRDGDENYRSCSRDMARLIREAGPDTLDGIVLDLRSNGGGALEEAVNVTGLFIDRGPVVQVRDHRGRVHRREDNGGTMLYGGPLVVLVDKLSASASEIVAAALQDHRRAVIVGEESTHGKGTVQTVYALDRLLRRTNLFDGEQAGSLKFTIQKFYRVNGGSTQVRGVRPDVIVRSFTDYMELGEAKMPHVLPWDEIEALKISDVIDVTPYLPDLKRRSERRRDLNEEFQQRIADIEDYAERQRRKTLTLNIEERRKHQEEEKAWSERIRKFVQKRRRADTDEDENATEDAENDQYRDLVLDESVQVLVDLAAMSKGVVVDDIPIVPDDAASTAKAAGTDRETDAAQR